MSAELLAEAAAAHGSRTALSCGPERVTYAELDRRADEVASRLGAAGVEAGDRVGLRLPNGPDWAATFYGILRAGAVAVPLNVLLRDGEVEERLAGAGARAVVGAEGLLVSTRHKGGPAAPETAVLLSTSGTTGRWKFAELTHAGLAAVARTLRDLLGVGPDDVLFGAAPLAHVFGLSAALNMTVAAGAQVALVPRFEPAAALELVEREGVSVWLGVPTMCSALLAAARESGRRAPRIRVAHCGGAPMPVAVLKEFADRFDCAVLEGYGLTETAGTVTSHRVGRPVKPGTVGEAIAGVEVRLADDGEVLVRGAGTMRGYWRNEAETRAALSEEGWLSTGDVGRLDEDGYLTLVDRKKDVILRGGYSVYPREVEEVLHRHPAVAQAVAVGVPHPELGEEVAALVVAREPVDAGELREWARERLAAYAYPRLVVLVDELPLGPTGKILRRAVDRDALRSLL